METIYCMLDIAGTESMAMAMHEINIELMDMEFLSPFINLTQIPSIQLWLTISNNSGSKQRNDLDMYLTQ